MGYDAICELDLETLPACRDDTILLCQSQCYRRQAIPMERGEIRPSVTLYSLNRSLPNLVWLITSATPTQMPILVKFGQVGNPRK